MNCDHVQEILSAFLDHEDSAYEMDEELQGTRQEKEGRIIGALSHLYGCEDCQQFFKAAVALRNIAKEERKPYPSELDDLVLSQMRSKSPTSLLNYHFNLPAYVVSAAVVILIAISFSLGFMMQENAHEREMKAILQAPPSEVVYGMPAQLVYPVVNHQSKGGVR